MTKSCWLTTLILTHSRLRLETLGNRQQLRVLLLNGCAFPRHDADAFFFHEDESANPVPFDFIEPVGTRGHRLPVAKNGQHGGDALRHGRSDRALDRRQLRVPGEDAADIAFRVPSGADGEVFLLDQQPVVALAFTAGLALAPLHPDQGEFAQQLAAVQAEFQVAGGPLLGLGFRPYKLVSASIPKDYLPRAIISGGDGSLEIPVVHGGVFHMDSQPFDGGGESWAVGQGPRFEPPRHLNTSRDVQSGGPWGC